jgi:formylglycine-generating enzyme required for sulfatase activity
MTNPQTIAKYEIISELGRGGFATVYRARDARMGREVALKVIGGNFAQEPAFVERFRQEALTAANLRHPNIVPVYDFGEAGGALYLAMALIGEGRTLGHLLAEGAPLPLERALPLLAQIAEALDYLHGQRLVHRDFKPSNVLLEGETDNPWAILTDFGLVRSLESSAQLTRSGSILGTPAYMAPEQADPGQWGGITPLTDVYALGVVTYQMLAGRPPFEGELAGVLHAQAHKAPPSPLELVPGLGDDLGQVLLKTLAKPPVERYPGAGALVAALQEVADTRSAAAAREASLEQLETQARELLAAGAWLEALDCCTRMMQLDPDRPAALEMLTAAKEGLDRERAEAVQRRRLEERYAEGLRLLETGKWKQAIAAMEEVAQGNPDFRDVSEKLAQARDELGRAQAYDEAIAHAEAKRWPEACRAWLRVLSGRPDYRSGEAAARLLVAVEELLGQLETVKKAFQQKEGDLQRAKEALALFDTLATAIEEEDWPRAVPIGEALFQSAPDLAYPQLWLERARRELAAAERRRDAFPNDNIMVWEKDGKEMVRVPAGEFLYGDDKQKQTLPEFWIDKTPVTNAEYARFVAETGHAAPQRWKGKAPPKEITDHPVTYVSWDDAKAYAEWAGKRLPTEKEWEKAARGNDGRTYPWGDKKLTNKLCNFGKNEGGTTPVGKYSPQGDSPYGCVDMSGNVWEWTASDYDKSSKVPRGGSWVTHGEYVRAAYRLADQPGNRNDYLGFRCVVEPGS